MLNQHEITAEILKSMTGAVGKVLAVSHPSDIADCVQDAVVRVLSSIESFDSTRGEFKGWCSVIACNVAKNWRKASANRGHDVESHEDEDGIATPLVDTLIGSDGRAEISRRADHIKLAAALARLDQDDRDFVEALLDGMKQTEAGAILGWSPAKATRKRTEISERLARAIG